MSPTSHQPHRPRFRLRPDQAPVPPAPEGTRDGSNPEYIAWLERQSMLREAEASARHLSGTGSLWAYPYALPDAIRAVAAAPVWFTAYPPSHLGREDESFLAALADPELWEIFERMGIRAVHTGPVKIAGGIAAGEATPSIDGHFDRIATRIDPRFGTEEEFRRIGEIAAEHGGTVIDDIVPAHTGKGSDFRLAEMGHRDYPGLYHMVEIDQDHWHLLPVVPPEADSANLDQAAEAALAQEGYIVGALQRVIFASPGVKETNWSATREVFGPDGKWHRWVYLHYFKAGQPSLNWLDPTFGAQRLVVGDALHSLCDLGTTALRLDANGFLGVERGAPGRPAWSEGHPLSLAGNQLIASMVRKLGGFTFQELNLSVEDIRDMGATGADLSYDFITRPGIQHAIATENAEFLQLVLRIAAQTGVPMRTLVHALQNHDELTWEFVHFADRHAHDIFTLGGREMTGADLAVHVRGQLAERLTAPAAPYNLVFTTNGISSTSATVLAAALGIEDLGTITAEDVAAIRAAHLLLAAFNALQPGVFALSGWDLVGALTLAPEQVEDLLGDGDTRWIHRAAYDLLGRAAGRERSTSGLPKGRSLYGPLPEQLEDPESFASRLAELLVLRERSGIAVARQVEVPDVEDPAVLVLVHEGVRGAALQASVFNVSAEPRTATVRAELFADGWLVHDEITGADLGEVNEGGVEVSLPGHGLAFLVFNAPPTP